MSGVKARHFAPQVHRPWQRSTAKPDVQLETFNSKYFFPCIDFAPVTDISVVRHTEAYIHIKTLTNILEH